MSKAGELWDGHQVKIYLDGTVPIRAPWRERPLSLIISLEACKGSKESGWHPPSISSQRNLNSRIGDEIFFSRSTIFMQIGQCGGDWEMQIWEPKYIPAYPQSLWNLVWFLALRVIVREPHYHHGERVITPIIVRDTWQEVISIAVKEKTSMEEWHRQDRCSSRPSICRLRHRVDSLRLAWERNGAPRSLHQGCS